eukprot:g146.t1
MKEKLAENWDIAGDGIDKFYVQTRRHNRVLFTRVRPTPLERSEFAVAYDRSKVYPNLKASSRDMRTDKVFPFPGASSWMLRAKFVSKGGDPALSPILDMDGDWRTTFARVLNDLDFSEGQRGRIYFVGHSNAISEDGYFGGSGRHYKAIDVVRKLHASELNNDLPVTISFQACNAAVHLCPTMSANFAHFGLLPHSILHCRIPSAGRYSGGEMRKTTLAMDGSGRYINKQEDSKKSYSPHFVLNERENKLELGVKGSIHAYASEQDSPSGGLLEAQGSALVTAQRLRRRR